MHLLWQALIGLVVGVIAKLIMPGRDPGGCIVTILLGIGGSMLFGFLTRNYFPAYADYHFIGAILGALLILIIYRLIFGEKT